MKRIALFVLIGLLAGLANCSTDAVICTKTVDQTKIDALSKQQLSIDVARISNYVAANNIGNVVADPSGLRYVIKQLGTGNTPCLSSSVVVTYSGSVLNSNNTTLSVPFDSGSSTSLGQLSNLILGWQIAFPKFNQGTVATLFIPSGMGYGPAGSPPKIGSNAVLVFDVTLVSFQ